MTKTEATPIEILDISKQFRVGLYRKKWGVRNVTFHVPKGIVLGLLGPNGSGKSTTIKMMLGFLKPTSGTILVAGEIAGSQAARRKIGYLPENPRFPKFMTAEQILVHYGHLLELKGALLEKRITDLLDLVGLSHARKERVKGFSKGMVQRLAIAQSLLNLPEILVLDEPMSGLDPLGRRELRKLIEMVHARFSATTIFFSTHILSDVEQLCDWVAVLRKGELTKFCRIDELLGENAQRFEITVKDLTRDEIRSKFGVETIVQTPAGLSFPVKTTDEFLNVLERLKPNRSNIVGIEAHRTSLEDALFEESLSDVIYQPKRTVEIR